MPVVRLMLVLTRRVGEAIMIGTDVVVKVVEVRGDQVRIAIEAPRSVPVHREEVHRELHPPDSTEDCDQPEGHG